MNHNHDCFIKKRRPELTIQVAEDYYNNNLSGQTGFVLADGFYSMKISEDDLNFEFSDDADGMSKIEISERIFTFFRNHFELHTGYCFIY